MIIKSVYDNLYRPLFLISPDTEWIMSSQLFTSERYVITTWVIVSDSHGYVQSKLFGIGLVNGTLNILFWHC